MVRVVEVTVVEDMNTSSEALSSGDKRLKAIRFLIVLIVLGLVCVCWVRPTLRERRRLATLATAWAKFAKDHPEDGRGHYYNGLVLEKQGKLDAAETELQEAMRLMREDVNVLIAYGNLLAKAGRFEEAIAQYRWAVKIDGKNAVVRYCLGTTLYRAKQYSDAVTELRRAVELNSKQPDCHCNLGLALHQSGQDEDARGELKTALKLNPNDGIALGALNRIENPSFRSIPIQSPLSGY